MCIRCTLFDPQWSQWFFHPKKNEDGWQAGRWMEAKIRRNRKWTWIMSPFSNGTRNLTTCSSEPSIFRGYLLVFSEALPCYLTRCDSKWYKMTYDFFVDFVVLNLGWTTKKSLAEMVPPKCGLAKPIWYIYLHSDKIYGKSGCEIGVGVVMLLFSIPEL